jgi:hypothetical protein
MRNDPAGRTYAEVIAEMVCTVAATGNFQAAKEIADRTEGKAKQSIDVTLTRTEAARYEKMVERLLDKAAANGTPVSREEAIECLAAFDSKILALLNEGSVTGH